MARDDKHGLGSVIRGRDRVSLVLNYKSKMVMSQPGTKNYKSKIAFLARTAFFRGEFPRRNRDEPVLALVAMSRNAHRSPRRRSEGEHEEGGERLMKSGHLWKENPRGFLTREWKKRSRPALASKPEPRPRFATHAC